MGQWSGDGWAAARGFNEAYENARIERTAIHLKNNNAVIVFDALLGTGRGPSRFDQYWHIAPDFHPSADRAIGYSVSPQKGKFSRRVRLRGCRLRGRIRRPERSHCLDDAVRRRPHCAHALSAAHENGQDRPYGVSVSMDGERGGCGSRFSRHAGWRRRNPRPWQRLQLPIPPRFRQVSSDCRVEVKFNIIGYPQKIQHFSTGHSCIL